MIRKHRLFTAAQALLTLTTVTLSVLAAEPVFARTTAAARVDPSQGEQTRHVAAALRWIDLARKATAFQHGAGFYLALARDEVKKAGGINARSIRAAGITSYTLDQLEQNSHIWTVVDQFKAAQAIVAGGYEASQVLQSIRDQLSGHGIGFNTPEIKAAGITQRSLFALEADNRVCVVLNKFSTFEHNVAIGGNYSTDKIASLRNEVGDIGFDDPRIVRVGITPEIFAILETANNTNAVINWFAHARKMAASGEDTQYLIRAIDKNLRKLGGIQIPRIKQAGITPESLYELDKQGGINLAQRFFKKARDLWNRGQNNYGELEMARLGILRAGGLKNARIKPSEWMEIGGSPLTRSGTLIRLPELTFDL